MKIFIVSLLLLLPLTGTAQQWNTSLESGLREAKNSSRNVLLFFSVPDACDLCVEFDDRVLQSEEFKTFSDDVVLVRIEFNNSHGRVLTAEEKARNLLIVEKYNKDGFFPLVLIIDSSERILGKAPIYDHQTPQEYIAKLKAIDKN